jgi:transposase-like protein
MPAPRPWKTDAIDLDWMCDRIAGGASMADLARHYGIDTGQFSVWCAADAQRSARIKSARAISAAHWDEKAERGLEGAEDQFELSRAKEMAHHYRWRASKISPDYGDKSTVTHAGAVAHLSSDDLSDDERSFITAQLKKEN